RLATALRALGVGKGDRVAIWLPNQVAWLASFFACARLGAIAISVNTRFRSVEVADLLSRSGARVLVYWPAFRGIGFDGILRQCPGDALSALRAIVVYEGAAGHANARTVAPSSTTLPAPTLRY